MNTITGCTNGMLGSATINVIPTVVPSISIAQDMGDTICQGTATNFTATATNGGTSPTYVWTVNTLVQGSGNTFSYVPSNNDIVACKLTSNATCASPGTSSTSMTMNVINYVMPSAHITVNPGNTVCPGTEVTYSATTVNGGTAPYTTWITNSNYTGSTGTTYSYVPSNGDIVIFMMVSNQKCRAKDTVYSQDEIMNINTPIVPSYICKRK